VAGANNHYIVFILEFFSLHFKRNYTLKVHFIQADMRAWIPVLAGDDGNARLPLPFVIPPLPSVIPAKAGI
jgi:hypothetical protein